MSEKYKLWFNIGPVQGFVGQARRTRDLWTSSWLLSNLTETALAKAELLGGKTLNPYRSESKVGVVESASSSFGGYPNWFVVEFDSKEQAVKAAEGAVQAFNDAWKKKAELVWDKKVKTFQAFGNETRKIWDRQIKNFWEISWSVFIGEEPPDRKAIRNVNSTVEPGTKCSLMGTYQEISGFFGKGNWQKQKLFWYKFSKKFGFNFNDGERLCAIALVKRLYPEVDGMGKQAWPSTSFIAALPWLRFLESKANGKAIGYYELAKYFGVDRSEEESKKKMDLPRWASLDAPYWYMNTLKNKETELVDNKRLSLELKKLYDIKELQNKKPVPYYALLAMDGDSMGDLLKLLKEQGKSISKLSEHLYNFSQKVPGIIKSSDGFTVYTGGDDVLALLPATEAISAAEKISETYKEEFLKTSIKATISGAIVYAHYGYSLRKIIGIGHHLLDDIAKEKTGRDSLALAIVQGSGLNALWSAPWDVITGKHEGTTALLDLIDLFGLEENSSASFNASYLYKLREKFIRLSEGYEVKPGVFMEYESDIEDVFFSIAHAEYRRRMTKEELKSNSHAESEAHIHKLMSLSKEWIRNKDISISHKVGTFGFDGWRVARFLKQVKESKVEDHG